MASTPSLRAGTYSRQSADATTGIETQRKLNREAVQRRGWEMVAEYVDNDVSASKVRGPKTDWARMLRDLESGFVKIIVATDQDRIVRTPKDLLELIDREAKLVTLNGEIDLTTSEGELHATMMAAWARAEVRRKAERQQRANRARAEKGKASGVWTPFGYADDLVTIIPEQAAAIRDGADRVLSGSNRGEVARSWNALGFTTNRGNPFNSLNVKNILSNPRYAGLRYYNGELMGEAEWEPILTREVFDAIQQRLQVAKHSVAPMAVAKHLLVGTVRCAVCDKPLRIGYAGNSQGKKNGRTYRCPQVHVSIPAEALEAHLRGLAIGRLASPDAKDLLQTTDDDTIDRLREERAQLRTREQNLSTQYALGNITDGPLQAGLAILTLRQREIQDALDMAERVDILAPLIGHTKEHTAALWDLLPLDRKRAILQRLLTVTVRSAGKGRHSKPTPERLDVIWHK
jgi:site-specific DNA recombinase